MRCIEAGALKYYQFESLGPHPGLRHAVFTRLGGTSRGPLSSLNVGRMVNDQPDLVQRNHRLVCDAMQLHENQIVTAHQVHGTQVAVVTEVDRGRIVPGTDGLATGSSGTALLLRFADCLPLMLFDPVHHACALVHSGWRGTVGNIAERAVQTMATAFGTNPADVRAGLGPCIRSCCYEIGAEVADRVHAAFGTGNPSLLQRDRLDRLTFDLPGAVARQLLACGVGHIEDSSICTSCNTDRFFSHRAEGGVTGRFAAVIVIE